MTLELTSTGCGTQLRAMAATGSGIRSDYASDVPTGDYYGKSSTESFAPGLEIANFVNSEDMVYDFKLHVRCQRV